MGCFSISMYKNFGGKWGKTLKKWGELLLEIRLLELSPPVGLTSERYPPDAYAVNVMSVRLLSLAEMLEIYSKC